MAGQIQGQGQRIQAKPKGIVPPKKPEGMGTQEKPRKLTAPALAKPTPSAESDSMMKAREGQIGSTRIDKKTWDKMVADAAKTLGKPGTIKKAISYAVKVGEPKKPRPEKQRRTQAGYFGVKPFWEKPGVKKAEESLGQRLGIEIKCSKGCGKNAVVVKNFDGSVTSDLCLKCRLEATEFVMNGKDDMKRLRRDLQDMPKVEKKPITSKSGKWIMTGGKPQWVED